MQRIRQLAYAGLVADAQTAAPPGPGAPAASGAHPGPGSAAGPGSLPPAASPAGSVPAPAATASDSAGRAGVAVKTAPEPRVPAAGSVPAPRSGGPHSSGPHSPGPHSPGAPRPPRPVMRGPQAATYWRRRFVALLSGLAVLGLITWAFTGALGGGNGSSASSAGQPGAKAAGQHAGNGSGQGSGPGAAGGGTATQAHPNAAPHERHGSRAAYGHPRPCPASSVVLSLFSSQAGYGAGALPQFNVDVVTTARQTCTFNVGARHVALIIRAGSVRVWSSADCVQGTGNLSSDLQRGVPTVLPISWNRQASAPGCPAGTSRMPAGTYTATVSDGSLTSNPVTFRIS